MYREMITPGRLDDGTKLRYGMGVVVSERSGRRLIRHGGQIYGFMSKARYYLEDNLTVVVLQNSTGPQGPISLADQLVNLTLGPNQIPGPHTYDGDLSRFTGRYTGPARGGGVMTLRVKTKNGKLHVSEVGRSEEPTTLHHARGQTWRKGSLRYRFVQVGEQIIELRMDAPGAHYVLRKVGAPQKR
jgi:hypothetical protein